jgi:hypothetical protein
MNKPIMLAIATLVILTASTFTFQAIQIAKAQYGGATGGNIEEQLKLAKAKITESHAAGAYGSGVPMLGTNINETTIFIGILVAIFGGVAAAFFIKSRSGAKAKATA